jgi:hypothetical protein
VNFSSYTDFRNKVQVMLDGDDISTSDLSTATLDLLIGSGEQRVYRDLRSSAQDTALSLTITSNVATLPTDFLSLRGAPYVGTFKTATYAPWEAVQNLIQIGTDSANHPVRYTFQGDTMIFYPPQPTGTVVGGRYFKRFADISTGLNAFFTRHPDVFFYAALAESAPFLGEQSRLQVWEAKYAQLVAAAGEQETRRVTRGSKLSTRVA